MLSSAIIYDSIYTAELVRYVCVRFPLGQLRSAVDVEMSIMEPDFRYDEPGGGVPGPAEDPWGVLRLIGRAVGNAMYEDWAGESLVSYNRRGPFRGMRSLPDDWIRVGSALEGRLMQRLVGGDDRVDWLSASVRGFLSLVVSGTRVLEDETPCCQVVWVSRGGLAEPVFVLRGPE